MGGAGGERRAEARSLNEPPGCSWSGRSERSAPEPLDECNVSLPSMTWHQMMLQCRSNSCMHQLKPNATTPRTCICRVLGCVQTCIASATSAAALQS